MTARQSIRNKVNNDKKWQDIKKEINHYGKRDTEKSVQFVVRLKR
jgi:hypothetical protein